MTRAMLAGGDAAALGYSDSARPVAVSLSDVGILGDLRFCTDELDLLDAGLLATRAVSPHTARKWTSRSRDYYRPMRLADGLCEANSHLARLAVLSCSERWCSAPSAYVSADYALNLLVRIAAAIAATHGSPDPAAWQSLCDSIDFAARRLTQTLLGRPNDAAAPGPITIPETLGQLPLRSGVDGDNHLITLLGLGAGPAVPGSVIGVLLGAGAAAPLAAAAWRTGWQYAAISLYDQPAQAVRLLPGVQPTTAGGTSLLLDDNCGTGRTLATVEDSVVTQLGSMPARFAIELHWEKLLRVRGFRHADIVFSVTDLTAASPWCYRHHNLLRSLIAEAGKGNPGSNLSTRNWAEYSLAVLRVLVSGVTHPLEDSRMIRQAASAAERIVDSDGSAASGTLAALAAACRQH